MFDQRCSHLVTEAGHDVHDPRWEARFLDELHQLQRRGGCELRGLDHHRITGRKRCRELEREKQQRRIPRRNARNDPQRFVPRVVEDVGLVDRNHRAFDLVGHAAVVPVPVRNVIALTEHLGKQFAVVANLVFGEFSRVIADEIAKLVHHCAALGGV